MTAREYLGTLHKPDPSLPIPNDDPRCHCSLEPDIVPEDTTVIIGGPPDLPGARVAVHADCVHHGRIARVLQSSAIHFSLGAAP